MADEEKSNEQIAVVQKEQKERDYYQKPKVREHDEAGTRDWSGSSAAGERMSGRTWGGGRQR